MSVGLYLRVRTAWFLWHRYEILHTSSSMSCTFVIYSIKLLFKLTDQNQGKDFGLPFYAIRKAPVKGIIATVQLKLTFFLVHSQYATRRKKSYVTVVTAFNSVLHYWLLHYSLLNISIYFHSPVSAAA